MLRMKLYEKIIFLLAFTKFGQSFTPVYGVEKLKNYPNLRTNFKSQYESGPGCSSTDDISYHGNSVNMSEAILLGTVKLYNIYLGYSKSDYEAPYQNSRATSTAGIVEAFSKGVGESPYVKIMQTYTGAPPTSKYTFVGNSFFNIPSSVTSLTDTSIDNYAYQAILQNSWPIEERAIYTVIFRGDISYTSNRLKNSAWNTYWCGYHTTFSNIVPGMNRIPISIIGDESFASPSLQSGCMLQYVNTNSISYVSTAPTTAFKSPNQNKYGDAVTKVFAHELIETASNIKGYGWFRTCDNEEGADLCNTVFDRVYESSDGTHYNVQFGNNKFLLQSIWAYRPTTSSSGCVMNSTGKVLTYSKYDIASTTSSIPYTLIGYAAGGLTALCVIVFLIYRFCCCCEITTVTHTTKKVKSINLDKEYKDYSKYDTKKYQDPNYKHKDGKIYEKYDPNKYNPDTYRYKDNHARFETKEDPDVYKSRTPNDPHPTNPVVPLSKTKKSQNKSKREIELMESTEIEMNYEDNFINQDMDNPIRNSEAIPYEHVGYPKNSQVRVYSDQKEPIPSAPPTTSMNSPSHVHFKSYVGNDNDNENEQLPGSYVRTEVAGVDLSADYIDDDHDEPEIQISKTTYTLHNSNQRFSSSNSLKHRSPRELERKNNSSKFSDDSSNN